MMHNLMLKNFYNIITLFEICLYRLIQIIFLGKKFFAAFFFNYLDLRNLITSVKTPIRILGVPKSCMDKIGWYLCFLVSLNRIGGHFYLKVLLDEL